jgi:hypothetical protein
MNPRSAIATVLLLVFGGCAREHMDDCFTGTGPKSEEMRTLEAFTAIRLEGRVDLIITVDSTAAPSARVEAGRKLLGHIVTEVRAGELHVDNTIRCNWVRSLRELPVVHVTLPTLERFIYSGIGDVRGTTPIRTPVFRMEQFEGQGTVRLALDVDTCYIGLHTGVGDAVLTGRTHTAHLYTANFAQLDTRDLDARLVLLNNSGSGDIRCTARDALFAILTNAGDVYYSGAPPVVDASVSGTGRLLRVE